MGELSILLLALERDHREEGLSKRNMEREVKLRREYRVKLEKCQLDYSKMLEDEELGEDIICPKCRGEKELVMTPYWGTARRYYTCYFVCPRCSERR